MVSKHRTYTVSREERPKRPKRVAVHTVGNLHFRYCLPPIHSNKPSTILPSTAQVQDQLRLVVVKCCEDSFETFHGEPTLGEEIRRNDHLLLSSVPL